MWMKKEFKNVYKFPQKVNYYKILLFSRNLKWETFFRSWGHSGGLSVIIHVIVAWGTVLLFLSIVQ